MSVELVKMLRTIKFANGTIQFFLFVKRDVLLKSASEHSSMRRFIDNVGIPCAVMLISSDVNFAPDLCDFKNRKKVYVIIVHGQHASESLLIHSNEHHRLEKLFENDSGLLSHSYIQVPQNEIV